VPIICQYFLKKFLFYLVRDENKPFYPFLCFDDPYGYH